MYGTDVCLLFRMEYTREHLSQMVRQAISTPELGTVTVNYHLLQNILQSLLDKLESSNVTRISTLENKLKRVSSPVPLGFPTLHRAVLLGSIPYKVQAHFVSPGG